MRARILIPLGLLLAFLAGRATPARLPTVRAVAVSAPLRLQLPRDAAPVRDALAEDPAPALARELLTRLGVLGDPDDFDLVADWTEHPQPLVAAAAWESLGRIGGPRALDRLRTVAGSSDRQAAALAITGLAVHEGDGAHAALLGLLRDGDEWTRGQTMAALAVRGGAQARRALHAALLGAPTDAWAAAQAVAALGGREDIRLLARLATGKDPRRDAALSALATRGGKEVDDVLLELAESARGVARVGVIDALGSVRDRRAVPLLRAALGESFSVQDAALRALGRSRAPGAFDVLLEAVDRVRLAASWQLCEALMQRPEPAARDTLLRLAQAGGPRGEQALATLANAGDARVLALMVERFEQDGRLPPENTLWQLARTPDGWDLLEEVLADGSLSERNSVVWALQSRGDADAVDRLLALARDDDMLAPSAWSALEAMGEEAQDGLRSLLLERLDGTQQELLSVGPSLARLGGAEVVEALSTRLVDADGDLRVQLVGLLAQVDDPVARATARAALDDVDPAHRGATFEALLWSPEGPDPAFVQLGLLDADPLVRAAALRAAPQSVLASAEELGPHLQDADLGVRAAALDALTQLGGPEAEAMLIQSLQDPELAGSAAWGLGNASGTAARAALRDAAGAGSPEVRAAAIGALSLDASDEARGLLAAALVDDAPGVASAATSALLSRGARRDAEALAAAFDALPDDAPARWEIASALQSLGGPEARARQEALTAAAGGGAPWLEFEDVEGALLLPEPVEPEAPAAWDASDESEGVWLEEPEAPQGDGAPGDAIEDGAADEAGGPWSDDGSGALDAP